MTDNVTVVDADTDDLDAFTDLFNGKTGGHDKDAPEDPVEDSDADTADADKPEDEVDEPEADATEADDDDAEEEDDEDVLKPKPKAKQTAKERIAELTRARHEAERREAAMATRLAALEARTSPEPTATRTQPAPIDPGAPDPDAAHGDGSPVYPLGEFDPTFIRDLTRFTIQQENAAATAERIQREQASAEEASNTRLTTAWNEKLATVEKDIPDLRPVIASLESELSSLDPAFGTYLAQTIMSMEDGPKVLYYLSNNVDETKKIIASGPTNATLALGRLEAKIQLSEERKTQKAAPTRVVSSAPKPPVSTRGTSGRTSVSDDADDLDAFAAKFFKKK